MNTLLLAYRNVKRNQSMLPKNVSLELYFENWDNLVIDISKKYSVDYHELKNLLILAHKRIIDKSFT